ncbi:MAG: carbon-nitrogen hydrolase family protein [Colwellia sp.]|nr:carbon-nitrogen hydrolase family protein [Colwellia sp.]
MAKIAIIQHAPCVLDKEETINQAVEHIKSVATQGAQLVIFPEAYIPGYPAWIWRLKPGGDWATCEELHARLLANAIDITTDDLLPIKEVAKAEKVTVVCGINERDYNNSKSTLFNSTITIDQHGDIVNHHRKLMPTNPERMVWGMGDGHGLTVIDTPVGRIGSLICWESFMPLARFALYSQGIEIYIAPTYDSGNDWIGTMQHIAREGRCWVLSAGVALQRSDLPKDLANLVALYGVDEDWINPGDSVVIAPGGEIVAGPMSKEKGYLLADIDCDKAANARRALDVAGHYARPDIFTLTLNKSRKPVINIVNK